MLGYWEKYLEVDLTSRTVTERKLDLSVARKYLGGRGLGAYLYLQYCPDPDVEPLGPENVVIIATGPLTGVPATGSGRLSATTRSPLSRTIMDTNVGGMFGAFLKFSGHDAIVIKGKSESPVGLKVMEDSCELFDAGDAWGMDTEETVEFYRKKFSNPLSVLSIGKGGENTVLYSGVIADGGRNFGRGGLGAVWGSKNLKTIVTRGRKKPEIFDKSRFEEVKYELVKVIKAHPITSKVLPSLGTEGLMKVIDFYGILPTRNFQQGQFEGVDKVKGETLMETIFDRKSACWGCMIACGRMTNTGKEKGEGPEYETTWAMGPNLGIDDLKIIAEAGFHCNRHGLDSVSTGSTIAWAMEATERGVYDFGIRFGEAEKLVQYIDMIASKEGVGELLALGTKRLSERFGGTEFAMHVKGLELPAYDPRGSKGMGVVYTTSNRGACHLRGGYSVGFEELGSPRKIDRFAVAGKGTHVARSQDVGTFYDSAVVCRFNSYAVGMDIWARLLNAVSNTNYTAADLEHIGERVHNLERLINLKLGFSKKDDSLPSRLTREVLKEGPAADQDLPLEEMLQEYYEYRGWTTEGVPTDQKIDQLDLRSDVPWL